MVPTLCSDARGLTTVSRPGARVLCAALAACAVLYVSSGHAQSAVRQVLLLQSADRGNLTLDHLTSNFRVDLDRLAGSPVNVLQVVAGPTGFVAAPESAIVDFIRSTYADRPKPDLIVTIAGPATTFARAHRQQLFPGTPLLLAAVVQRFLNGVPLADNEAAVPVANDYPGMIDNILQLLPRTKQVFMVMGSGELGRFWRGELEEPFSRFRDRLTFIWSNELSLPEILRRCASLPRDSVIFYFTFGTDAAGAAYADERVLADIHATANAPVFGVQSPYLGYGIVGGPLVSIDDVAHDVADVASRLLGGASPKDNRLPPRRPGQPVFDWRELQRWGIADSRLPPGSIVRFEAPGLWSQYRNTVMSAVGILIVQSLLIVGLLYQRRARQRAEIESRRHMALAADASRRQTMSALTNSMTHELGQPLGAMVHNAQALQVMVAANRATPDTIAEILSDIQTQGLQARQIIDRHRTMLRSHQIDTQPIDVRHVIQESLSLVAHDLRRRDIDVSVDVPASPCTVDGDQVLLQQVIVNLVMNAMDAMAETPPARRRVTVGSEVRSGDVRIFVADRGTGLPAQLDGKLFAPFVTTKPQGLGIGLTIVRTIVDAHGGSISAFNNADGGATFTVTLHCSDTAAAPAATESYA